MAYRCTEQALEKSFQKVGPTFLQLFSNILEAALAQVQEYRKPNLRPMSGAAAPATELKLANACLQSVTKILSYYAKIKAAILLMARHRVLSLMIALLRPSGAVSLEGAFVTSLFQLFRRLPPHFSPVYCGCLSFSSPQHSLDPGQYGVLRRKHDAYGRSTGSLGRRDTGRERST